MMGWRFTGRDLGRPVRVANETDHRDGDLFTVDNLDALLADVLDDGTGVPLVDGGPEDGSVVQLVDGEPLESDAGTTTVAVADSVPAAAAEAAAIDRDGGSPSVPVSVAAEPSQAAAEPKPEASQAPAAGDMPPPAATQPAAASDADLSDDAEPDRQHAHEPHADAENRKRVDAAVRKVARRTKDGKGDGGKRRRGK